MKLGVLIYGIGRGVDITFPEFQKKLFSKFSEATVIYVVNEVSSVSNPRSNEYGKVAKIDSGLYCSMRIIRTHESELLTNDSLCLIKNILDVHNDGAKTYRNLLCQLSMLKMLRDEAIGHQFDQIVAIRDDVLLHDDLAGMLNAVRLRAYLNFSMFHWHGGVSDRFVFGPADSVLTLLNRGTLINDFASIHGYLNGEHLVDYSLRLNRLKFVSHPIRLSRVRLHGVVKENFVPALWRPMEFISMMRSLILGRLLIILSKFTL